MSFAPDPKWRFYLACRVCDAPPAQPCQRRLRGRPYRRGESIQHPHKDRQRALRDQTPLPPPRKPCEAVHPAYRVPCDMRYHRYGGHLSCTAGLGVIHWPGEPYPPGMGPVGY